MKNENIVNDAMTATLVLGFILIFMTLAVEAMRPTQSAAGVRVEAAK